MLSIQLVFFQLFTFFSYAEDDYAVYHYTKTDGFLDDNITAIHQDRQEFMWFLSNFSGLSKYDGHHFKAFPFSSQLDIKTNDIYYKGMLEDEGGMFWILNLKKGLICFDPIVERYELIKFPDSQKYKDVDLQISFCRIDEDGLIWIGTKKHLFPFNTKTKKWEEFITLPENLKKEFTHLFKLSETKLLIGDENRLYELNIRSGVDRLIYDRYDPQNDQKPLIRMLRRDPGAFWIILGDHLYVADTAFRKVQKMNELYLRTAQDIYSEKHFFNRGNRQIALLNNDNKLTVFDRITGKTEAIIELDQLLERDVPGKESLDKIFYALFDGQNNLWVGVQNQGAYQIVFPQSGISRLSTICDNIIQEDVSNYNHKVLFVDKAGGIWYFNPPGKEMNRLDPINCTISHFPDKTGKFIKELYFGWIQDVGEDLEGNIWFLLSSGRFFRLDIDAGNYTYYNCKDPETAHTTNYNIGFDELGFAWTGGFQTRLLRIDPETSDIVVAEEIIINYHNFKTTVFCDIVSIPGDRLVFLFTEEILELKVDSSDHGELKYEFIDYLAEAKNNLLVYQKTFGKSIECSFVDTQNNLWFGTQANGLLKLNLNNKELSIYSVKNGLCSNRIDAIQEDIHGNMWVGTDQCLSKLDPKSGEILNFYTWGVLSLKNFYPEWRGFSGRDQMGRIYFSMLEANIYI